MLAFKGPVAASQLYGDLGLRPFGDLDILVQYTQLRRACDLLVQFDYVPHTGLAGSWRELYIRTHNEMAFRLEAADSAVDLHWARLSSSFSFTPPANALWAEAEEVDVDGMRVHTLAPHDMLLYLCLHVARHCWEQIGLLADIAQLLRSNPQLDWDRILSSLSMRRGGRQVLVSLALVSLLWKAPIPDEIDGLIAGDSRVGGLVTQIINDWTRNMTEPRTSAIGAWRSPYRQAMQCNRDRLLYLWICLQASISRLLRTVRDITVV